MTTKHLFIYCTTRTVDGHTREHYLHRYPSGRAVLCGRTPLGDTMLAVSVYGVANAMAVKVPPKAFQRARLRFREKGMLMGDLLIPRGTSPRTAVPVSTR